MTDRLRRLETRLTSLGRDVDQALARAKTCIEACLQATDQRQPRRLRFQPVQAQSLARRRVRFTPLARGADRVVITNWNPEVGFVSLGDVELELEPGQSAVVWLDRMDPSPRGSEETRPAEGGSLFLLPEEHSLLS